MFCCLQFFWTGYSCLQPNSLDRKYNFMSYIFAFLSHNHTSQAQPSSSCAAQSAVPSPSVEGLGTEPLCQATILTVKWGNQTNKLSNHITAEPVTRLEVWFCGSAERTDDRVFLYQKYKGRQLYYRMVLLG